MESRFFIKTAGELIKKIKESQQTLDTPEALRVQREALQKDINQMFIGLQNPTLPSAYNLRDAALRAGFFVDPKVINRLSQFEFLTA